jgi:hypothetical protein
VLQGGAPHVQLDLENHRGKVTEWLQNEPVQGEIRRQFKRFLRTFKDDNGDRLYVRVIENMVLGELDAAVRALAGDSYGSPVSGAQSGEAKAHSSMQMQQPVFIMADACNPSSFLSRNRCVCSRLSC